MPGAERNVMSSQRLEQGPWSLAVETAPSSSTLEFCSEPPPCPGDTFVFRETAEVLVEWAVIERDPADEQLVLVVPLDAYPQIGSRDVKLLTSEPGRVVHIRCDLDVWLETSRCRPELRTGSLPPGGVDDIRHKRLAIASGKLEVSLLEEKVDGDPEYRRWKDEILGAMLAALRAGERLRDSRSQHARIGVVADRDPWAPFSPG